MLTQCLLAVGVPLRPQTSPGAIFVRQFRWRKSGVGAFGPLVTFFLSSRVSKLGTTGDLLFFPRPRMQIANTLPSPLREILLFSLCIGILWGAAIMEQAASGI